MSNDWDGIVDSLRGEIAGYGRLLDLIEGQRRLVLKRDLLGVVEMNPSIHAQAEVLSACRERRERAARELAAACGQPSARTLRALLPLIPVMVRPLVAALIAETNHLVHRLRRAMAANQRLLACTVERQEEFIRQVWPAAMAKTYSADGSVAVTRLRRMPALQTAG